MASYVTARYKSPPGLNVKGKNIGSRQWLEEIIKLKASEIGGRKLDEIARNSAEMIAIENRNHDGLGFHNVTGNLYSSMAFSVVKTDPKTHRYILSETYAPYMMHYGGGPPTRKSLKQGEMYNQEKYYYGDLVETKRKRKPYVGEYGMGGQSGPDEAARHRARLRSSQFRGKNTLATLYFYVGIGYAKYVDFAKGRQFMQRVYDIIKTNI